MKSALQCLVLHLCLMVLMSTVNCAKKRKVKDEEIWEQDLGDAFKIDESTKGLQKVNLKCGADTMAIELLTEEDFTGVMYTRGSFYKQSEPCFVKPRGRQTRHLEMKFSMNQCQTVQDGDVYSNVVVVQHDPELVTPGDAAFVVECDFRKPRSLNVAADIQTTDSSRSRITLTSPDPSVSSAKSQQQSKNSVASHTNEVTFVPNEIVAQKVEGTVETVTINMSPKKTKEEL